MGQNCSVFLMPVMVSGNWNLTMSPVVQLHLTPIRALSLETNAIRHEQCTGSLAAQNARAH